MERYVIEFGRGFAYSIRKYLARKSGRKARQVGYGDIVNEFLIPVLEHVSDQLRTVSKSSDWSFHIYRVKKVPKGYKLA